MSEAMAAAIFLYVISCVAWGILFSILASSADTPEVKENSQDMIWMAPVWPLVWLKFIVVKLWRLNWH